MPELKNYAIGSLTVLLLLSLGFVVSPDDSHFCRDREVSYYCHDLSSSGKTCYTQPLRTGRKVCYAGWEAISDGFVEPKVVIDQSSIISSNPEVACNSRSCVFK